MSGEFFLRAFNDAFRRTGEGGRVLVTNGLAARGEGFVLQARTAVAAFDAFDDDNDPWGEHDVGILDIDGCTVFWKIDYYDPDFTHGSEDPADPDRTQRVLTLMLAEEY